MRYRVLTILSTKLKDQSVVPKANYGDRMTLGLFAIKLKGRGIPSSHLSAP
jgi:hypothetical protein